jgi:hypothetical protein
MRSAVLVVVQFGISLLAVGLVLPAAFLAFPATQRPSTGMAVAAALWLVVFVLLRAAWPRRRSG